MKIIFLDTDTMGDMPELKELEKLGEVAYYPFTLPSATIQRVVDADIIITNKVVVNKQVLDAAKSLKLICVAATGTNNVDLDYAKTKGISVKNAVGYSTHSVAHITFSLVFQLLSRLSYFDEYVKSGEYSQSPIFTHIPFGFNELQGKVYGIIGLGNIGKQVAKIADAFGCKVVYHSVSGTTQDVPYERLNLDAFLQVCDVISIHAPLNEKTKNLLGEQEISQMKPNAILINVGRGGIVDESALALALEKEVIFGAGLDVFSNEPLQKESPLLNPKIKDKLVLLPHIAWSGMESRRKLLEIIIENIKGEFP